MILDLIIFVREEQWKSWEQYYLQKLVMAWLSTSLKEVLVVFRVYCRELDNHNIPVMVFH